MDFIIDAIVEWLKGLLVDGIMGNLDGLFDNVNQSVGEIATQVGTTPADWNAGVFSMIRQISETAILPIAGVILTFVMTYELIQMLIERNNLHEVDTWMFFKWVFKTFVAVMILTNTFNIVLAVFDVSQHVIQQSAGIIQNGTEITPDVLDSLRTELEAMELGPLFGLWLQSFLIQLTMIALNIVIFVIVYGRMIEIYLLTSLAPIPYVWQFHGNYSLLLKNFVFGRSFDNVFLKKQHNYPHQMPFFLQCSSASIDASLCGILIVAGIS